MNSKKLLRSLMYSIFVLVTVIVAQPTITSFTPTSGPIDTIVTIIGTNFNTTPSNNIVFFGAVKALVTSAASTLLTVAVPIGATIAPITVTDTTTGLTAYSNKPFIVTFQSSGIIYPSSFASKIDLTSGTHPGIVAIGDIDGDGKPDLVVANYSSNTVSVLRNTSASGSISASSFSSKVDFVTGIGPYSVAIGDIDGDGKPDLVVTNDTSNTVSVLRNKSTSGSITASSFSSKIDFATGFNPYNVAIGDLDGDGKPDLVVANKSSNTVSVLKNTTTIGSITASSFASKVDFTTWNFPRSVTIGDLDGDGKPDIVIANYSSNFVSVLRNTSISSSITSSSFASRVDFVTGNGPYSVAIGDVNGDRKPDLVATNYLSNTVSVLKNTSTSGSITESSFSSKVDFVTGNAPSNVAIGDLDGDGKLDLVFTNQGSVSVSVLRNTSTSDTITENSFSSKVDFMTGGGPYSVTIGDLDGDGKPDFVVANNFSNTISIYRNKINTAADIPSLTMLVSPENGAINQLTSLMLTWSQTPKAEAYHVQCGTDSTFSTGIIVDDSTLTDTSITITDLSVSTKYFWRVKAWNALGSGPFSSTRTFVTTMPAPTSVASTPGNQRIILNWTASVATNILLYRIYRGTLSPATTLIDSTSTTQYVDSNLINGTRYFYRITSVNNLLVEGPFSSEVNATPLNAKPHAKTLSDIYQPNSIVILSSITFSSQGSFDSDGTVDSLFWFLNGKLLGNEAQFTRDYGQGTNKVMLVVQDNQGAKDTSIATVNRSKFKFFLGGGVYAGPSLLGNNILYVIGTGDAVYRLDSTGNDLYSLQVGGDVKSSSSISSDTTVYIASSDKNLYAFSKFGASLWPALPLGGILTSTPAVDSITNRIYVGVSNKNFFAVNRTTGTVAWNYFADAPIVGSAVITLDRKLVFATVKGTIYGFDLNNLSSPPSPSWQLTLSDSIIGSPAIDGDGYVYYCTTSGKVVKISLPRNQQPSIVWQKQIGGSIIGSPVIDGYANLYVGSTDAKLYAIKTETGNIKWSFASGSPILSTSAVSDVGLIYFGNHGGSVFSLDTSSTVQWYYNDSASIDAPLLYQRGVLYVGTVVGRLIAFYDNADSSLHSTSNSLALKQNSGTLRSPVWGTFQGNNQRTGLSIGKIVTLVEKPKTEIPKAFSLSQNYPNPFNPTTIIEYDLPKDSQVRIVVFDMLGRQVKTLVNEEKSGGRYKVEFNASSLSSGIYFYRMTAGNFVVTKKLVLMK